MTRSVFTVIGAILAMTFAMTLAKVFAPTAHDFINFVAFACGFFWAHVIKRFTD